MANRDNCTAAGGEPADVYRAPICGVDLAIWNSRPMLGALPESVRQIVEPILMAGLAAWLARESILERPYSPRWPDNRDRDLASNLEILTRIADQVWQCSAVAPGLSHAGLLRFAQTVTPHFVSCVTALLADTDEDDRARTWDALHGCLSAISTLDIAGLVDGLAAEAIAAATTVRRPLIDSEQAVSERKAFDRDACWLRWHDDSGQNCSGIRDHWNSLTDDQRRTIAPQCHNQIGGKGRGADVVRKGIAAARRDRETRKTVEGRKVAET